MEKLKEEVIANLRACLISFKGKASVRQLEGDYRTLLGERIPYSKLGYKSVEDFISHIPSLNVSRNSNGDWYVDAKASEKSNHITDMVNKQKTSKKRVPLKTVKFHKYSKAPQTRNWSPTVVPYKAKKWNTSKRTAAVSHNQLVMRSPVKNYQQPQVASKVVIPEQSIFNKTSKPLASSSSSSILKNVDTTQRVNEKTTSNVLLRTPMRTAHLSIEPPDSPTIPRSILRTKSCNFDENQPNPVDLETFAKSLVHSSRKRITRMMSEVSLDRDSGNSSPTNESKCVSNEIELTDDPIADLKNIANMYKLGTVDISHTSMVPKKRYAKTQYNCKITVDGQTYLSYPEEFYDKKSAEEFCAKKALDEVVPKCTRKKTLLLSTSKDIKDRIPPMLQTHFQGIWSWQIEEDYADRYLEQLPLNWLEIIDSCNCVEVERLQGRYVLRYCQPGTKGVNAPTLPLDISIPSKTVQFGEDNRLHAHITCMMSLNEVWANQVDSLEYVAYTNTIIDMEVYYNKESYKHKVETVQLGSYYVACYESCWYRVRALEIKENEVNCFLIDHGEEYLIPNDSLYTIRREFATVQAQAFVCRLVGLEDFYDAEIPSERLASYVDKEVVLEAAQNDADDANTNQTIAVIMYDLNSGNSINEELLRFLTIETATPIIKPHIIQEVVVSHLADNGIVYVQVPSKGFTNLEMVLKDLEKQIEEKPPLQWAEKLSRVKWTIAKDRLYLSKDEIDSCWRRSRILDMSPDGTLAQVYFVDKGNFKVTTIATELLYPLDKISDVLHQFPAQAVSVKMALDSVPANFVELVSKWIKVGSPVLLKILDYDKDHMAVGEFYKRFKDKGLICINKSIVTEMEMSSKADEDSVLKGTRIKLVKLTQLKDEALQKQNVPSGGLLVSPDLPQKGKYFPVHIPFAVNPWNFFVQPFESREELNQMMHDIQENYKDASLSPLQIKSITPGQIYATKHTDNIWYRTSVLKVIHSGSISVFYCDFGYYASLSINQLIPLDPKFTVLPYQALKAKLSGIKPKNNKWSMEDCVYFSELVKGKSFMSVLIDIEKDELYESDPVLKLTLIDTSTDEDLFIDQVLVEKNIAIKAD